MFKNNKKNIAIVLILILSLICGTFAVSFGATAESKRKEAKEAGKKAAQATANLEDAIKKLEQISKDIEATKANIEQSKKDIKKKEKEIKKQEEGLNDRLTAMYKTGTVGYVDVILSSEDITDLISNIGMVQKILENDQDLLKKLEKKLKKLEKLKKKLEQQEVDLEIREEETEALKAKFKKEADEWKAKEEQLNAEAQQLAAEALAHAGSAEALGIINTGQYAWPTVTQNITSPYGWRICPFHGREFHDGLDIACSGINGKPIYAIQDGVITRASRYSGYGNCVILTCAGGISALYAHLSGYNCSVNQVVKKGQVLGYVGSTGNSTGPHLHFMVFKDGVSINPWSIY